jgi:hypothetical protein
MDEDNLKEELREENRNIEEDIKVFLECSANYILFDRNNNELEKDKAKVRLNADNLSIMPELKQIFTIPYRETMSILISDYKVFITLVSSDKLVLSNFGLKFDDFVRILNSLRNEIIIKDMLVSETIKKPETVADFVFSRENGETQKGKTKLRLYETAFVMMPDFEEPVRIPYSFISDIKAEDYSITILTEFGESITLSKMGGQFNTFKSDIVETINELLLQTQSSFKDILPGMDVMTLKRVTSLLRDGKAIKRSDIERISGNLWKELEGKINVTDAKEDYEYLKSLSNNEEQYIGIKRDLLGNLTGEYLWFLISISSRNAIAMETVSEDASKATYFFRTISRKHFQHSEQTQQIDRFVKNINRAMIVVNFRREPIYLSEDKLKEPQYQNYLYAIQRLPELNELRNLFIGRVVHSSIEQWKRDVMELLDFNIKSVDDREKWVKVGN